MSMLNCEQLKEKMRFIENYTQAKNAADGSKVDEIGRAHV